MHLYYTITITLPFGTQLSKYTMTVAHEASPVREPIGIAEKRQQYFDICDNRFNMPFLERNFFCDCGHFL